jgi:hypothetical protein
MLTLTHNSYRVPWILEYTTAVCKPTPISHTKQTAFLQIKTQDVFLEINVCHRIYYRSVKCVWMFEGTIFARYFSIIDNIFQALSERTVAPRGSVSPA